MRAVIFDIDDTLLHSASGDDRIYRRAVVEVLGDVQQRSGFTRLPTRVGHWDLATDLRGQWHSPRTTSGLLP